MMSEPIDELRTIASGLMAFREDFEGNKDYKILDDLKQVAAEVGRSWSRSWLGYQACVYYSDLNPPPPGHHFSSEWGFDPFSETTGEWVEFTSEQIEEEIHRRAGDPDLSGSRNISKKGLELFLEKKEALVSILQAQVAISKDDAYLAKLLVEANAVISINKRQFIQSQVPSGQLMTRDTLAGTQGLRTPPHIAVLGEIAELQSPAIACQRLAAVTRRVYSYLERVQKKIRTDARVGTNVFIGHGRSKAWRELKDFIQDRLHLPWDEFNRVPVAGNTNIARLSEMLDAAAIALIVMTAEDEQPDGKVRARMNVIHEAGLFQGRLGFSKAILLLEEGCDEFSNIQGLGQIRFPNGKVAACFEEVRRVLEREGLIEEA